MKWEDYKQKIKAEDPNAKEIIEEAEEQAVIIASMITKRAELGLSQRDLAALCDIPQSSVARIESYQTTPRLDTVLKILRQLGLTLRVVPSEK